MEIIHGFKEIKRYPRPVVAIGVFDGVHAGHRRILRSCVAEARRLRGTAMVLTFHPHPQKEQSIYSFEHRLAIMSGLGVKACVVIPFNRRFAAMSAEDFIIKVLCGKLGARRIFVGNNFRFGRGLAGGTRTLRSFARRCGYAVRVFPTAKFAGRAVSSTRIRAAISRGKLSRAAAMLAGNVSVFGTVVGGRAVGRMLGFPTANIDPHHEVLPPPGIYAVRASVGKEWRPAVCYIGTRPTFADGKGALVVEVHLFDFAADLYGKHMEVRFIAKIRGGKKFPTPGALAAQIKKDIAKAKKILSAPRNTHNR